MGDIFKRIKQQYIDGSVSRGDVIDFVKRKVITREQAMEILKVKEWYHAN